MTKRCSLFTPSPVEKKNVSEGWQTESRSTMQDLHYLGLSCLCDNRLVLTYFSDLELDLVAAPPSSQGWAKH